jgi:two-component system response regulator AtoC
VANYSSLPARQASPPKPCLFVFESNAKVRNYLHRTFSEEYNLRLFSQEDLFLKELETEQNPKLVLFAWDNAELSLPLFTHLRAAKPDVPVVILSCSSEMADYEIFARLGASCVVLKPFVDNNLQIAIAKHLPARRKEEPVETKEVPLGDGLAFVRSSKRMREIESQAMLVAPSDIPVLILGESGTGKEIIALYTHKMSRRSKRVFLKINCAAMPAELLESELFGYEQGAFTGAIKMKPGKFETCNGGTIFLDEIGEMPAILQAKLLQVLQDGTFSRLGSRAPMRTDVRVIAATNINMKEAMANKTFREDLYYRLNGLSLVLPPLRDRLDEIPAFAAYFMRKGANKHELQPLPISQNLLTTLCQYHWPGNLRELENVINRYLILKDEKTIIAELLLSSRPATTPDLDLAKPSTNGHGLKRLVRGIKGETESAAIATVLEEKGWNRKAAATDLQISYKALLYKIKQYELTPKSM